LQLEKGGFAVVRDLTQRICANLPSKWRETIISPRRPMIPERPAFRVPAPAHQARNLHREGKQSYDQVLGDLEKGNGDPALTLFPKP